MSELYGWLEYDHHGGIVTRTAHHRIDSVVKTWHGQVIVQLQKGGDCRVIIKGLAGGEEVMVWSGNIDLQIRKPEIKIEIRGGLIEVSGVPPWMKTEIVNHDNLAEDRERET